MGRLNLSTQWLALTKSRCLGTGCHVYARTESSGGGPVTCPVLTLGTSSERGGLVGTVPLAPEMAAERVQLALPVRVLEVLREPHPAGRASAPWPVLPCRYKHHQCLKKTSNKGAQPRHLNPWCYPFTSHCCQASLFPLVPPSQWCPAGSTNE